MLKATYPVAFRRTWVVGQMNVLRWFVLSYAMTFPGIYSLRNLAVKCRNLNFWISREAALNAIIHSITSSSFWNILLLFEFIYFPVVKIVYLTMDNNIGNISSICEFKCPIIYKRLKILNFHLLIYSDRKLKKT